MIHSTSRRLFLGGAIGGLGAIALGACGAEGASSAGGKSLSKGDKASLVVGVLPISTVAPLYAAQENGYFADEGLDVQIQTAAGAPQLTAAIEGGSYHVAYTAPTPLLLAASQGVGLAAIAPNDVDNVKNPMNQVLVDAKSSITDLAGLEGKTIAVNTLGGILQATTTAAVKQAGGDPSKVKFIPLPFQQMLNALSQGRVDAVVVTEPFVTQGLEQGCTSIANPIHEILPNGVNGLWYTSSDYASQHKAELTAFRAAIMRGLSYVSENPDEARQLVAGFTKISAPAVTAMSMPAWATAETTDAILRQTFDDQVRLLDEYNMLKGKVDTASLIWSRD